MANLDQSLRRSDDDFCRHVRGHVPAAAHGPPLAVLYLMPYPNAMWMWPQFRSPLVWDVFAVSTYLTVSLAVLVCGPDSGPRHPPRSRQKQEPQDYLWHAGHGLARFGRCTGRAMKRFSAAGGSCDAAGRLRTHRRELRFYDWHCSRVAHHDLSRLISSRAPFIPASPWC